MGGPEPAGCLGGDTQTNKYEIGCANCPADFLCPNEKNGKQWVRDCRMQNSNNRYKVFELWGSPDMSQPCSQMPAGVSSPNLAAKEWCQPGEQRGTCWLP